jgi:hypothetical protein
VVVVAVVVVVVVVVSPSRGRIGGRRGVGGRGRAGRCVLDHGVDEGPFPLGFERLVLS